MSTPPHSPVAPAAGPKRLATSGSPKWTTRQARRRIEAEANRWPETFDPDTGRAVPLTEIREVPAGWRYLGYLGRSRPIGTLSGDTPRVHLLHAHDAWALMYTNPISGRATPGLIDCYPSLGATFDDCHVPGLRAALGLLIAAALSPAHAGLGLLLRLGNTSVALPKECYAPGFGLPA